MKLLADGSNKRVPSPSTVSTTELTRWITVTMEACEGGGEGRRRVGGRDPALVQTLFGMWKQKGESDRETKTKHMESVGVMPTQVTLPCVVAQGTPFFKSLPCRGGAGWVGGRMGGVHSWHGATVESNTV